MTHSRCDVWVLSEKGSQFGCRTLVTSLVIENQKHIAASTKEKQHERSSNLKACGLSTTAASCIA